MHSNLCSVTSGLQSYKRTSKHHKWKWTSVVFSANKREENFQVPATTSRLASSTGQYKKRLLQKYEKEQEGRKLFKNQEQESTPPEIGEISSPPITEVFDEALA